VNFTNDSTLLKERTQTINNKIKLHIVGVGRKCVWIY